MEMSVLSRGLLFIPTPVTPLPPILKDVREFSRLLRLAYNFRDAPPSNRHPFKPPSGYTPGPTTNLTLEGYIDNLAHTVPAIVDVPCPTTNNLGADEWRAIRSLRANRNIVVNKSDKGSEVVVSDMDHYIVEGVVHLSDVETYVPVGEDPTPAIAAEVTAFAKELLAAGYVDEIESTFIQPPNPVRTPVFYHLWKTHKVPLSIRPIVSGCSGPTANLSTFLDFFLKGKLREVPAHIKDTDDFVRDLTRLPPLPEDTILVTADVKSLYTMIPQDEGIEALLKCSDFLPFPPHLTKTALSLVLKKNVFRFNQQMYHQKTGVAMGSPISPTLAIVFMDSLETPFLASRPLKPLLYRRYIDDVFFLWTWGEDTLVQFLAALDNMHPSIKFTWVYSKETVNFLDLTIFKPRGFEGCLAFKPYSKPTSRHLYIQMDSHHPVSTKRGVIRGEALRIMRRCSEPKYFASALLQLKLQFRARGYTNNFVNRSLAEVLFIPPDMRTERVVPPHASRKFFFKTFFDSRRPPIKPLLVANWLDLCDEARTKQVFEHAEVYMCLKNVANIRRLITRSALRGDVTFSQLLPATHTRPYRIARVASRCGRTGCLTCPIFEERNCIISAATRERFPIATRMTCSSSHLIYVIRCVVCGMQYVGETVKPLHLRVNNHREKFRSTLGSPNRYYIYRHFDLHGGFGSLRITPYIACDPANHEDQWRTEKETILSLKTYIPYGINSLFHRGTRLQV